ncbi:hypothetical protein PFTANZ_04959 [Plasmodium falciparum Tanzania (2000708)]|uniref:Uncharacterized protein n=1 Tax=Plasmodium falciparum Tanzania (2000708) TaxID=1036725 RepID=A0A024VZZ6_PLAFA|nr:hypothetical protein PFTANZ_04959 [Plasmodium falciparum Tanzania (2000708)]
MNIYKYIISIWLHGLECNMMKIVLIIQNIFQKNEEIIPFLYYKILLRDILIQLENIANFYTLGFFS